MDNRDCEFVTVCRTQMTRVHIVNTWQGETRGLRALHISVCTNDEYCNPDVFIIIENTCLPTRMLLTCFMHILNSSTLFCNDIKYKTTFSIITKTHTITYTITIQMLLNAFVILTTDSWLATHSNRPIKTRHKNASIDTSFAQSLDVLHNCIIQHGNIPILSPIYGWRAMGASHVH